MNENIDLTKILDGCPIGTEFYSSMLGEVVFIRIDRKNPAYPIVIKVSFEPTLRNLTKQGKFYAEVGECTLFPSKEQRDWSKFVRFWDKPKVERFDPKTLKPFDKVLVRDEDCYWTADLFSHIDDSIGRVCCGCFRWKQCIPYNEETKDLIGTKKDCPEYYKWWEK